MLVRGAHALAERQEVGQERSAALGSPWRHLAGRSGAGPTVVAFIQVRPLASSRIQAPLCSWRGRRHREGEIFVFIMNIEAEP